MEYVNKQDMEDGLKDWNETVDAVRAAARKRAIAERWAAVESRWARIQHDAPAMNAQEKQTTLTTLTKPVQTSPSPVKPEPPLWLVILATMFIALSFVSLFSGALGPMFVFLVGAGLAMLGCGAGVKEGRRR